MKDLKVVYKHNVPYGIRNRGGYLLFFPTITKFPGQETRYKQEIADQYVLAHKIIKALKE